MLTLECEVAIDCVFVQSDIPLDLMDCERNSAVVSFNDSQNESVALDSTGETASDAAASNGEILATFRCQADTRQLQIRVCTIEGHFGLITVYVISRLTPKVCLVRQFHVKALSLHKRKYFDSRSKAKQLNTFSRSDQESDTTSRPEMASNQLVLIGSFSLSEAHSWLCNALPEVPDKLTTTGGVEYTYECTLTGSILRIQLTKGRLAVHSNSVSSVSILKEFCTREATRKGIAIELRLQLSEASLKVCLAGVHKRLCPLIQHKQTIKLQEAINELIVGEPESVQKMISELKLVRHLDEGSNVEDIGAPADSGTTEWQSSELDRLYGLIADLYIDYQKLNGVVSRTFIQSVRSRVGEMIALIEKSVSRDEDFDTFVCKLNAFWGFPTN